MTRALAIVRREYIERVRSRVFVVATLLAPLIMLAFTALPSVVMERQRGKPLRVAVLGESGALRARVEEGLGKQRANGSNRFDIRAPGQGRTADLQTLLRGEILKGNLDGYLELPPDALSRSTAEYHAQSVSNLMDRELMERVVEDALVAERLAGAGIDPHRIGEITRKLDFKTLKISATGEREDRGASFFLSFALLMMLYSSIAIWGAALMNGVIEEKSNRVVEVMVSSVSTTELFAGKLLGVGAVGLTQFLVWAASAGLFGLYASQGLPRGSMPDISAELLLGFVVFFLLGYFLYAALYAAIGASVNTQQEAQSLVFPAVMPLIGSIMLFPAVLNSPDSAFSTVLSLIPLFTPLLMFLRITTLTPPAWQIATSIVLTLLTVIAVNWAAARIYRVGILMYGKRPTLPEILRWISKS